MTSEHELLKVKSDKFLVHEQTSNNIFKVKREASAVKWRCRNGNTLSLKRQEGSAARARRKPASVTSSRSTHRNDEREAPGRARSVTC